MARVCLLVNDVTTDYWLIDDALFTNFRFKVHDEAKYIPEAQELMRPERNTLTVSFQDVESYNSQLATTIQEEYYR